MIWGNSINFFKFFIVLVLPPAIIMLGLLLLPLPEIVAKSVLKVCDKVLFSLPHPYIPLSLFWTVFFLSSTTFLMYLDESLRAELAIRGDMTAKLPFEDHDRMLIRALANERNVWISGCNVAAWGILHRYRSLLKRYYRLKDTGSETKGTNHPGVRVVNAPVFKPAPESKGPVGEVKQE